MKYNGTNPISIEEVPPIVALANPPNLDKLSKQKCLSVMPHNHSDLIPCKSIRMWTLEGEEHIRILEEMAFSWQLMIASHFHAILAMFHA